MPKSDAKIKLQIKILNEELVQLEKTATEIIILGEAERDEALRNMTRRIEVKAMLKALNWTISFAVGDL